MNPPPDPIPKPKPPPPPPSHRSIALAADEMPSWSYERGILRRNGKFFAFVSASECGESLPVRKLEILLLALNR